MPGMFKLMASIKKRPTAITVDHNKKPYLVSTTKKQNINDIM